MCVRGGAKGARAEGWRVGSERWVWRERQEQRCGGRCRSEGVGDVEQSQGLRGKARAGRYDDRGMRAQPERPMERESYVQERAAWEGSSGAKTGAVSDAQQRAAEFGGRCALECSTKGGVAHTWAQTLTPEEACSSPSSATKPMLSGRESYLQQIAVASGGWNGGAGWVGSGRGWGLGGMGVVPLSPTMPSGRESYLQERR
jgi:hypothetical protein